MATHSKSILPPDFDDVIYGPQILPDNRYSNHELRLDGVHHFHRRQPQDPAQGQPARLIVTTSGDHPFDEVRCWYRISDLPEQSVQLDRGEVEWDGAGWRYIRAWSCRLPAIEEGMRIRYRIGARRAGSGEWQFADSQSPSPENATVYSYSPGGSIPPDWAADAVIYQIFLDRFYSGEGKVWEPAAGLQDFHGGTLQGVHDKLDYLQGLGANTLWLSPVFASPSHHGYDSTDLMTVEPRFGSNADLEKLIRAMHSRGMRIILDFVPNHWSRLHPTFQHALSHADSPFRDWYLWKSWPDEYEAYFDVRDMPKLNLHAGSPARRHLLEVARFWLQRGVDGFRLDHAEGPPHDFLVEFRQACQEANAEVWLFAEIVRPPGFLRAYEGAVHGCLDFALARALRQTFALDRWSLGQFESFLSHHEAFLPPGFSSPAFLDNHDMHRFLFIAGEEEARLRLAGLLLFSLPAAPVLYYGTERGISQDRTFGGGLGLDEARKPVDWEEDSRGGLQRYFARLASLRRDYRAGRSRARRLLHLDEEAGTYAFLRGEGELAFIVAVNTGNARRELHLDVSLQRAAVDLLGDQVVHRQNDALEIVVEPMSGVFIASGFAADGGQDGILSPLRARD